MYIDRMYIDTSQNLLADPKIALALGYYFILYRYMGQVNK